MTFVPSKMFTIDPLQSAMKTRHRDMKAYFTDFKNNVMSKKTWPMFDLTNF